MKGIVVVLVLLCSVGFSRNSEEDKSERLDRLFACGEGTEVGFNGWMVHGLDENVNTYFDFNRIELFTPVGGAYTVTISKKLDQMVGYSDINIAAQLAAIENCQIEHLTAQLSTDGKEWVNLQANLMDEAAYYTTAKMNFQYLRLTSHLMFSKNGRMQVQGVKVFGGTQYMKLKQKEIDRTKQQEVASSLQSQDDFHLFSFEKQIHIETKSEDSYQIEVYNSKGLSVKKSRGLGSERFDVSHLQDGLYFVVIKQKNKAAITKKVAL